MLEMTYWSTMMSYEVIEHLDHVFLSVMHIVLRILPEQRASETLYFIS